MDTNQKGDIGLAKVIADIVSKGYFCYLPMSQHLPIDLIITSREGETKRVQVKYAAAKNSVIRVKLYTTTCDGSASYANVTDKNQIDIFAVYCPDIEKVIYVDTKRLLGHTKEFSISFGKGNIKSNRLEDFLSLSIMFNAKLV